MRIFALLILLAVACLSAVASWADDPPKSAAPAADSMLGKEAGEVRDDNRLKLKLVWCPPGAVTMEQFDFDTESRFAGMILVKVMSRGY